MAASPPTALQRTEALRRCTVDAEGAPLFGYLEHLGFVKTAPSSGSKYKVPTSGLPLKGRNSTPSDFQERAKREALQTPHTPRSVSRSHPPEVRVPPEAEVQHFRAGCARGRGLSAHEGKQFPYRFSPAAQLTPSSLDAHRPRMARTGAWPVAVALLRFCSMRR